MTESFSTSLNKGFSNSTCIMIKIGHEVYVTIHVSLKLDSMTIEPIHNLQSLFF